MQLSRTFDSLHACTEDPGAAVTSPVSRPRPGDRPLRWYLDTKPRFYRPYLIRVLEIDDTTMQFVFLNASSGADLPLSRASYRIAYHDGRYAYSDLPSTAPKVRPGSTRTCGLLFITDLYMQALPRTDLEAIALAGHDDEKWPRSMGKAAPPRRKTIAARRKTIAARRKTAAPRSKPAAARRKPAGKTR